jgi:hypothetical protein
MSKVAWDRYGPKCRVHSLIAKPSRSPVDRDAPHSAANDQTNGRPNDDAQSDELQRKLKARNKEPFSNPQPKVLKSRDNKRRDRQRSRHAMKRSGQPGR